MTNILAVDFIASLNAACDARIAYEADKNAANESIKTKINSIRKSLTIEVVANTLIACAYNAESINEQVRTTSRRNVYSVEKDANIARFLCAAASLNHYTLAVFKTALALEANALALTHKAAQASCSQDVKHSDAKIEKLIKATRYAKHIDASTASTQSSSSINALEALNVFTVSRNAANEVTYTLNRDAHATQQIAAKLELSLEIAA
jgi:hypothetical protein